VCHADEPIENAGFAQSRDNENFYSPHNGGVIIIKIEK